MIFPTGIHIHIPRTGGSLVRSVIQELVISQGNKPLSDRAHVHLQTAREKYDPEGKIVAHVFVRNPWDWYVSRFLRARKFQRFLGDFELYIYEVIDQGHTFSNILREFTSDSIDGPLVFHWFESLVPEVMKLMHLMFPDIPTLLVLRKIRELGHVRANLSHPHYSYYFQKDNIRQAIQKLDEAVIHRFGYEFERSNTWTIPRIRGKPQ